MLCIAQHMSESSKAGCREDTGASKMLDAKCGTWPKQARHLRACGIERGDVVERPHHDIARNSTVACLGRSTILHSTLTSKKKVRNTATAKQSEAARTH